MRNKRLATNAWCQTLTSRRHCSLGGIMCGMDDGSFVCRGEGGGSLNQNGTQVPELVVSTFPVLILSARIGTHTHDYLSTKIFSCNPSSLTTTLAGVRAASCGVVWQERRRGRSPGRARPAAATHSILSHSVHTPSAGRVPATGATRAPHVMRGRRAAVVYSIPILKSHTQVLARRQARGLALTGRSFRPRLPHHSSYRS